MQSAVAPEVEVSRADALISRAESPLRVLVVDSDAAAVTFVRDALPDCVDIVERHSAEAALEALRRGVYDAMVLALLLPGTIGLEVLRGLAPGGRPRRIVVLTRWRPGALDALKAGAHVVIAKPCTIPTLRAALGLRVADEDDTTRRVRLMVERTKSGAVVNEDAVHVLVGTQHWVVTRIRPQLSARHATLEEATEHGREVAAHDRGELLVHDARGNIVTRESYRDL